MSAHTITIELDLGPGFAQDEDGDFYPVDPPAFETQVVDKVAESLMGRLSSGDRRAVEEAVTARVDGAINERLTSVIEEVVAGPLRKYDYQGRPSGEPFTVNELIVAAVERFASAPAKRDSFSSSGPANLTDLVHAAVRESLGKELASDIAEIRRSVAGEIKERLMGAAADAIAKVR